MGALRKFWCTWTHGGGHIVRDPAGHINWRCARCGRWSDKPVLSAEEDAVIAMALAQDGSDRS